MIKPHIKQGLFASVLLLLLVPNIQKWFKVVDEKPLFGSFAKVEAIKWDSLSYSSWLDGSFQTAMNEYVEANIGFHASLVRVYNELRFLTFKKAAAEGVIVGAEGELFEEDYLRAATGEFFVGEDVWMAKALQLKAVQDTLQKLGKYLLVVIEPGKGTLYADRYPSKYSGKQPSMSNYVAMKSFFEAQGVHVIDFNSVFLNWKDQTPYRLFPRIGTHWSYYGASLAADSLLRHLKTVFPDRIHGFKALEAYEATQLRHPDDDIWLTMNLIRKAPIENIGYTNISFHPVPENGLRLLTIGDSFYFNWLNQKVMLNSFADSHFWYYNKLVYNHIGAETGQMKDLNFSDELLKNDVILLMITERFHQNFAWGFDTRIYEHFFPGQIKRRDYFMNEVRIGNLDFIRIYNDARKNNMTLQHRLKLEAEYRMFNDWQKHPEFYTNKDEVIDMMVMAIKGSPDWLASVQKKARERNISDEEMLKLDAEWMYDQKYKTKE